MNEFIPEIIFGASGFILGNLIWLINYFSSGDDNEIKVDKNKIGGAGKRWTDYDHRFLIENKDLSNQTLAKALNRTTDSISTKKSELNLNNKNQETTNKSKQESKSNPEVKLPGNRIDKIVQKLDLSKLRPQAQLDPEEVARIYLSRKDKSKRKLGRQFGVDHSSIGDIWRKNNWKWLTDQIDEILEDNNHKQLREDYDIEGILNQINIDNMTPPASRKLTPEDVIRIYLSNEDRETLSKIFDCSESNIRYIRNRDSWNWLTDQVDQIINKRIDLEPSQRNELF